MKRLLFLSFCFVAISCLAQQNNYYDQDNTPAPDDPVNPARNYTPAPPQQQPVQRDNYAPPQNYNNAPPPNYNNANVQVNYASPSYQTFYDDLSPYGYWVNYPNYGYVWVPNVGPDFRPYCSNGHWVYTEYGWTWASNYNWGWAPFHYGRWNYDALYGWMWIPGHEWAPAWVTWGSYNGYYGWAPVGPGVVAYEGYRPAEPYWNYCPAQHFTQVNVNNYTFNNYSPNRVENVNSNNMTIINNSNTYNNAHYYSGPKQAEVEHATGTHVNQVTVNSTPSPTNVNQNPNQINLYRPTINPNTAVKSAPVKTLPVENLKTVTNNSRTSPQNQPVNQQTQPKNINQERVQPVQNEQFNRSNNPPKQFEPPVNQNNQPRQVTPEQRQPEPVHEQPKEERPNTQQQAPQQQQPRQNNNNKPNNQNRPPVKQQPRNPPPAPNKKK